MAINKNHEFEELNGVKCAIVEKNTTEERVAFLKPLLEFNHYNVIVVAAAAKPVATPQPKPTVPGPNPEPNPQPQPEPSPQPPPEPQPPPPEMFTIGVTDVTFNPTNAIFGRILKTKNGHIVTPAYWQQKDPVAHDEIPYYEQIS